MDTNSQSLDQDKPVEDASISLFNKTRVILLTLMTKSTLVHEMGKIWSEIQFLKAKLSVDGEKSSKQEDSNWQFFETKEPGSE